MPVVAQHADDCSVVTLVSDCRGWYMEALSYQYMDHPSSDFITPSKSMVLRNLRDYALRTALSATIPPVQYRHTEEFEENEWSPAAAEAREEVDAGEDEQAPMGSAPPAFAEIEPTQDSSSVWSRLKSFAGVATSRAAGAIDEAAAEVRKHANASYQEHVIATFSHFDGLEEVQRGSVELHRLHAAARLCAHLNSPNKIPNSGLHPRRELSKGSDDKSSSLVGYSSTDHTVYVCFRGTKTAADVLTDLSFTPVPITDSGISVPAGMLQRVDTAFTRIIESIWGLRGELVPPAEKRDQPLSLCICGHSLGGGLAMVLALLLLLREEGRDLLEGLFGGRWRITTIGAPLALAIEGDPELLRPDLFRVLHEHALHLVHQFDPITRLLGRDGAMDFSLLTASSTLKAAREKYYPCGTIFNAI